MTQHEFETRTKVNVTSSEFEIINQFYMSCEADKDEFCRAWVKLNPQRVSEAKEAARAAVENEARRDMAWEIYLRLVSTNIPTDAAGLLTGKQSQFLRDNDIEEMGTNACGLHYFRDNWEVALEVSRKFNLRA